MSRVLLVDSYNLYIRNWQVIPIKNDDGEHFGGVFGYIRGLRSAIEMFKPTEVVVAWDGQGSGLRRKNIYKEYKANRKDREWSRGRVKAFDFMSQEEEADNFHKQLKRIREYLEFFPIKTIQLPYVEADDIIAEYVRISNQNGEQCVIYSTDGDYKQLVNGKTICYNPIAKKFTTKSGFIKEHNYLPENFIFIKLVSGDSSDNIPGIKGLGEKTFLKLYPDIASRVYSSATQLIEETKQILVSNVSGYTKSQLKWYQTIIDNTDLLQRNYDIMQLHEVDISAQARDAIAELKKAKPNQFMRGTLKKMLLEDKMISQIIRFDSLSQTFSGLQVL